MIESRYGGSNPLCAREDGGLPGVQGEGDLKRPARWEVVLAIDTIYPANQGRSVGGNKAISISDNY